MVDNVAIDTINREKMTVEAIVETTVEKAVAEPDSQLAPDALKLEHGPAKLVWRALLLDEDAYQYLMRQPATLMRGTVCLLFLLLVLALARAAGLMLNQLTSIRIGALQDGLYTAFTQTQWFAQSIAAAPEAAGLYQQLYPMAWQIVRFVYGLPTWGGIFASVLLTTVGVLLLWLLHGTIAHWLAHWQGSNENAGRTYGGLALALSPLLVTAVAFLPGLIFPTSLLFLWVLIGQYQGLKAAHGLSWPRTLVAAVGPYLIVSLLLLSTALIGILALIPPS